jgi:hypothetical protein
VVFRRTAEPVGGGRSARPAIQRRRAWRRTIRPAVRSR